MPKMNAVQVAQPNVFASLTFAPNFSSKSSASKGDDQVILEQQHPQTREWLLVRIATRRRAHRRHL
jgi:hypothetical protein